MASFYAAPVLSAELVRVETRSVGALSLPAVWNVISKDEGAEKSLISPDLALNVQQVLYAKAGDASADQDASLQVFSIWGAGGDGSEKSLPDGMFGTQDKFVTGLIGGRYGNVSELGEESVETALENIAVATYGVTVSLEGGPERRYKSAFLYSGGKRVLALLSYGAESETYWRGQMASLLDAWVGSLTFTPASASMASSALNAPLPVLPTLPGAAGKPETLQPGRRQPRFPSARWTRPSFSLDRIPIGQLALVWGIGCFVLYVLRKRDAQKHMQAENERPAAEPANGGTEAGVTGRSRSRAIPTLEEWLAEEPLFEREEYVPPASSDGGFDRVYNLFDHALNIIGDSGPEPAAEASENPTSPEGQQ